MPETSFKARKARKGILTLMGSGELTSTMVEVHKELLGRVPAPARAAFLDTPAGFQLNVGQLSQRALQYFHDRVHYPMSLASFKSMQATASFDAEMAFHTLKESNYVLIGPGSPTYAVKQWLHTPVREIFINLIADGGCLVAASAAALTIGRFTIPVYEIYKVGDDPQWFDGLDVLGHLGFNLAVVPHWNNAEGGTHDTRFCYMGEERFLKLEKMLPEDVSVLGLDEHTACIMDFPENVATVKGIGRVVFRHSGAETIFVKGDRFSLDLLHQKVDLPHAINEPLPPPAAEMMQLSSPTSFWDQLHEIEDRFHRGVEKHDTRESVNALLDLDSLIWKGQTDMENPEFISQAREILRDFVVLLGARLDQSNPVRHACLAPLVDAMLQLRSNFRQDKRWNDADAVRDILALAGVLVEDTEEGALWRLK